MTWIFGTGGIAKAFYEEDWLLNEGCFMPIDLKCKPYMVLCQGKDQPWDNFYWDCIFFSYKWTIDLWSAETLEMMCYTNPPFDDRFILRDGPTYETKVIAFGGPESQRVWDRVFHRFAGQDGDYFEYKTCYPARDKEILTFILQQRINKPKPKRPVFIAIRSHFEYSLMDDELDFNLNVGEPTPSVLGGLFFYKNVAFFLDPFGAAGKYPDFFFPVEDDWMAYPRNDFHSNITVPIPVIQPIIEPLALPVSNTFHEWTTMFGYDYEPTEIIYPPILPPWDWRPLFIQDIDNWIRSLPDRFSIWVSDSILELKNSKLQTSDFSFRKRFFKKFSKFFDFN